MMMLEERIRKILGMEYTTRILIYDKENFKSYFDYELMLMAEEFAVYLYDDIERIRYKYESEIKTASFPCAIVVKEDIYVPADIRKAFHEVTLSLKTVFPRMDQKVLASYSADLELIDASYDQFEMNCLGASATASYIADVSFSRQNIQAFIRIKEMELKEKIAANPDVRQWTEIAKLNARLEKYACLQGISRDQTFIDEAFLSFVMREYAKLAATVTENAPVILPKVMDKILDGRKVALIVADGMSMFDFTILSDYMKDYDFDFSGSCALIPTTTSISRQSLLAGKYPVQLENPFSLAKEESQFYDTAENHGYARNQTFYGRGYDRLPGAGIKAAVMILNDIDDMVHGQQQGRMGMYNDVSLWAKEGKILTLFHELLSKGFEVYLTADHGNTHCCGVGSSRKFGVETETKSKRMIVLRDFAEITDELKEKTCIFPGTYLNKNYQYLICKGRTSFDHQGADVMTHGGISLEEVIVPFVKVREKNG